MGGYSLDQFVYEDDDEPYFYRFEDLLHFVEEQIKLGVIDVSDEFLEQRWDDDLSLIVGQIAMLSGVSTKAALYATLWAYVDPPADLTIESIDEYIDAKGAGNN